MPERQFEDTARAWACQAVRGAVRTELKKF